MITKEDLIDIYRWVASPIVKIDNIKELEEKIIKKYCILPKRVWNYDKPFTYTTDGFIKELFQRIEFSNELYYIILNKGRKFLYYIFSQLSLHV